MSDLGNLRERIDRAVDHLSELRDTRDHGSQSLVRMLSELEEKYRAREAELEYSQSRIAALTAENQQLIELADKLVGIVETTVGDGPDDPIVDAAALASQMLDSWSSPTSKGSIETEAPVAAEMAPSIDHLEVADPAPTTAPVSGTTFFEDVEPAILQSEFAAENLDASVPDPVTRAMALAAAIENDVATFMGQTTEPSEVDTTGSSNDDPFGADAVTSDIDPLGTVDHATRTDPSDYWPVGTADDKATAGETERETILEPIESEEIFELGDDLIVEDVAPETDIEIPETLEDTDTASNVGINPLDDQEASIREMMARLEEAAERAKAGTQSEPGSDIGNDPLSATGTGPE